MIANIVSGLSEWLGGRPASELIDVQSLSCVKQELASSTESSDWDGALIAAIKKSIHHLEYEYRNWAFHCVAVWERPEFRRPVKNPRHREIGKRLFAGGIGGFSTAEQAREHLRKGNLKTSEEKILEMLSSALVLHEKEAKHHLAVRDALGSHLSSDTLDRVWRFGCLPILESEVHKQTLANFEYTITLKPKKLKDLQDEVFLVTTRLKAERRIEATPARVIFARTKRALDSSYLDDRCLLREFVKWSEEEWQQMGALMDAHLIVDGTDVKGAKLPLGGKEALDKLIYEFRVDSQQRAVPVTVESRFPMRKERVFPVLMSNYFCTGVTEIDFELDVDVDAHVEAFPTFAVDEPPTPDTLRPNHYTIRGRDLIWPGAGVIFVWEDF